MQSNEKPSLESFLIQKPSLQSFYQPPQQSQESQEQFPGLLKQAGRIAGQALLGGLEAATLPYDLASMPTQFKSTQRPQFRQEIAERIQEYRQKPNLTAQEQQDLNKFQEIYSNPDEFLQTSDVSASGLIQKATGINTRPEGFLEKTARIGGLLKKPGTYKELAKVGSDIIKNKSIGKDAIKAILPTKSTALTAPGVALGLEAAEAGEFGVPGTIAASIVGGALTQGLGGAAKGGFNLLRRPKETLAKVASAFSRNDKTNLQKGIINDFRENGIQADLGSITDSNFIKLLQTKIAQSGLLGKDLENFIASQSNQVRDKYKELASTLGNSVYGSKTEASTILQDALIDVKNKFNKKFNTHYEALAEIAQAENAVADTTNINNLIDKFLQKLEPGTIKGKDTKKVINTLKRLKNDSNSGRLDVLINNKMGLNEIIDYNVTAKGPKKLLRAINKEIDNAIASYKGKDGRYGLRRKLLDKEFSTYAKNFRNKKISSILNSENPTELFSQLDSVQGIRRLRDALTSRPEGKNIFNSLARTKFEDIFAKSLGDSASNQIKLGSFKNVIKQGKNTEIIKELLGKQDFEKLKLLSDNVETLQKSLSKYYNSSQSAASAADIALISKSIYDMGKLFIGNPWPLVRTGAGYLGLKGASKLLSDPEFLKMTEEIILNKAVTPSLASRLGQKIKSAENARVAAKSPDFVQED